MEVIMTDDKAKRDAMFDDLRKNGNELERKVVKFSGSRFTGAYRNGRLGRPVTVTLGGTVLRPRERGEFIPVSVSTWSVAYPRIKSERKSRRKNGRAS